MSIASYRRQLLDELGKLLDLCEQEWGFRPPIEVHVDPIMMVTADFNLKGFAHKGGRTYVTEKSAAGYRKPKNVARSIVGELAAHKNTCERCGDGGLTMWQRIAAIQGMGSPYSWYRDKPLEAVLQLPDGVERACYPRRAARLVQMIDNHLANHPIQQLTGETL